MNPIDYWYQKYLKEKLTAEDVQLICELYEKLWWDQVQEIFENDGCDTAFYEEVLKRFNEQRNATDAV